MRWWVRPWIISPSSVDTLYAFLFAAFFGGILKIAMKWTIDSTFIYCWDQCTTYLRVCAFLTFILNIESAPATHVLITCVARRASDNRTRLSEAVRVALVDTYVDLRSTHVRRTGGKSASKNLWRPYLPRTDS